MNTPHVVAEPHILYPGTPGVLVSTVNEDGTHNLAPISSAFWPRWRGILGIASASQTTRNLLRNGECVLNLPSPTEVGAVDRIDPDKWSPLIMNFQKFYGLGGQVHPSRLAEIPEQAYAPLSKV